MDFLELGFSWFYQYIDSVSALGLSAIGLVVIFGVMGVINMAHGELMMIGAYVTSLSYFAGVPVMLAIILGTLAAAIFGMILERLIIRRFYGQLLSSLVVTWGVSLLVSQSALIAFGPSMKSVPTPFGSFSVGELSYSYYRIFMFFAFLASLALLWYILIRTQFGARARATMENPEIARALGVNTSQIYSLMFGLGSGFAGFTGGLLALTASVGPYFGQSYTPQAFITVVVGGSADILLGLVSSVLSLALVKSAFTSQFNILSGHAAMLMAAFLFIWLMPSGISSWLSEIRMSAAKRKQR